MTPPATDASTRLYGVFGDPVGHSLSPAMHSRAFAHAGVNAAYLAFHVKDLKAAVNAMRALGMGGASVTIPHKSAVMQHLDEVDLPAQQMGAVNTIINQDGRLVGKNSDCLGAVRAILEHAPIRDKKVVVLGAGGAARAIAFGVKQEGGQVVIANRTWEKAQALADSLVVEAASLDQVERLDCQILINATSVGMVPDADKSPAPASVFKPGMVVMDIVYRPLQTRFLREARQAGCITLDGLSMFVHQGACQFEWWTGKTAPVDAMREAVENALSV